MSKTTHDWAEGPGKAKDHRRERSLADKLRSIPGVQIVEEKPIPTIGINPYGPPTIVRREVADWLRKK